MSRPPRGPMPERYGGAAEFEPAPKPAQPAELRRQRKRAAAGLGALALITAVGGILDLPMAKDNDVAANNTRVDRFTITLAARDGFKLGTGDGGANSPASGDGGNDKNGYIDYFALENHGYVDYFALSEQADNVAMYPGEIYPYTPPPVKYDEDFVRNRGDQIYFDLYPPESGIPYQYIYAHESNMEAQVRNLFGSRFDIDPVDPNVNNNNNNYYYHSDSDTDSDSDSDS